MSVPNLRDIGGILVSDGRHVKSGFLLRSAALAGATNEGLTQLRNGGLAHVVDLRTQAEITSRPDPHIPGVSNHHMDVYGDTSAMGVTELSDAVGDVAAAQAGMISAYRNMIILPSAHRAYRRFLDLALRNEPLLFHCTEGKDRTGWGATLLLTLLSASPEQIEADYLRSNLGLIEQNAQFKAQLMGATPPPNPAVLDIYLNVAPNYLKAALDEAAARFASLKGYVNEALGFDDKAIAELRRIYLAD